MASLVKEDVVCRHMESLKANVIKVNKIDLLSATKKKISSTNRMLHTKIWIDGKEHEVRFFIVPKLSLEFVIGIDIIQQLGIQIDGQRRCVHLNNIIKPWMDPNMDDKGIDNDNVVKACDLQQKMGNGCGQSDLQTSISKRSSCTTVQDGIIINNNVIMGDLLNDGQIGQENLKYKGKILNIIEKNIAVINNKPGQAKRYVHRLIVDETASFKSKSYPVTFLLKDQVRKEINKMLEDGVIESSKTRYVNTMVVVK